MFTQNMSLKAEYIYYDLGTTSFTGSPLVTSFDLSSTAIPTTSAHFNGHVATLGLNYHFDFLQEKPITAAY
jgi:outer membrane immunogenic protein